ncbi:hypothetical protein [Clostridium tyrobutyricum]|uniref:hypothetical protein n=1 Tax=Clostridium tyrobutyricum TaxID=1519 RepID=UPI001C38D9CC|nr:hypothetical protein [Clostridium tyrobutyricum]MBV4429468.1 hypothetical protein [Clostridium tyrobutyricum]MBV4444689.1 hypothetical protein [Clostridium tyrobutyricum]
MSRWKKKSVDSSKSNLLPGQMSVFDIGYETMKLHTAEFIHNKPVPHTDSKDITPMQEKTLKRFISDYEVSRAAKCGKSLEIEVVNADGFIAYWIGENGREDFHFNKRASILSWDKVVYYSEKFKEPPLTEIQKQHFDEFLEENDCKKIERIIHRKGDLNILIEYSGKIIDIISNGWVLEFNNIKHINCMEDEVVKDYSKPKIHSEITTKIKVKVGDLVQALHGEQTIEGRITREYGMDNDILNIEFKKNNGYACTAIGRRHVLKVLQSV